jgi:ferredoxin--NADP+ reductase
VTREDFVHRGRLTTLLEEGRMAADIGLDPIDPGRDRFMICGSPSMLADFRRILDARGFSASPKIGVPGHYVFERAFVEK